MYYSPIKLSRLPKNQAGIIVKISADDEKKLRFYDLGLVPGTKIKRLFASPAENPAAYEVMGTVIALRNEDADEIFIRKI